MILIADSGSTKTDWILWDATYQRAEAISSSGINPFYQSYSDILAILEQSFPKQQAINEIYFYGAGCIGDEKNNIVKKVLYTHFKSEKIEVHSDLLGAARSLLMHKQGIACIMGTGSNSGFYDGTRITKHVSPLGYILGDEGSAAHLGKLFIADLLKKQLPLALEKRFFEQYNFSPSQIIDRVYRQAFPNRFLAQFALFLSQNEQEPEIKKIISYSMQQFIQRNLLQYEQVYQLPVSFTGSIAHYFRNTLTEKLIEHQIQLGEICQSPIKNLSIYHTFC